MHGVTCTRSQWFWCLSVKKKREKKTKKCVCVCGGGGGGDWRNNAAPVALADWKHLVGVGLNCWSICFFPPERISAVYSQPGSFSERLIPLYTTNCLRSVCMGGGGGGCGGGGAVSVQRLEKDSKWYRIYVFLVWFTEQHSYTTVAKLDYKTTSS